MVRIFTVTITNSAKKYLSQLKARTNCDAVEFQITEVNHRRWLLLQCVNTATDAITYFAPFPCPANPDTATLDYDGEKFTIK